MKRTTIQGVPSKRRAPGFSPLVFAVLGLVVLSACAAPIGVQKVSSHRAQQDLTGSVLSSGELSEKARNLLRRTNQEREWKTDPAGVLTILHESFISEPANAFSMDRRVRFLDSLAELAFAHAVESKDRRYYLAAAMYAWFYLFPGNVAAGPHPLERGVRLSADLYNRGLTLGLTDPDSGQIMLRDGDHPLPFGTLRVDFDEESLIWGDRVLSAFASLADLRVNGLNNRYRMSGLGAPLGARLSKPTEIGRAHV